MTVLLIAFLLLFVIVGFILSDAKELGSGADAVKGVITLAVLTGVCGYLVSVMAETA